MRVYVDVTEPGALVQKIRYQSERAGIPVERSLLHKREGSGPALARDHPFYGYGCDVVISDDSLIAIAVIERKTLDDLARSMSVSDKHEGSRLFRQLTSSHAIRCRSSSSKVLRPTCIDDSNPRSWVS